MQRLDSSDLVGLCDDELYRRYCTWPGVYSAPSTEDCCRAAHGEEESDPDALVRLHVEEEEGTALYHACQAQYFHSQLPLTENADASSSKITSEGTRRHKRTYISKEFAQIGSTEACSSLRAVKKKLNECHRDEEGYFYILQLKTERLSGDVEIFLDEYRNKRVNVSTSGEEDGGDAKNVAKVNESNNKKEREEDSGEEENEENIEEEFVRVKGTINVEAIAKIWIVRREGAYGMSGKFTCADPPMISIDDF